MSSCISSGWCSTACRWTRLLSVALRAELTRLIAQGGMQPRVMGGAPRMVADPITIETGCSPLQMGVQLARSLYGGIARPAK